MNLNLKSKTNILFHYFAAFFLLAVFALGCLFTLTLFTRAENAGSSDATEEGSDFDLYQKYEGYLKYLKKEKYNDYKKYKKYKEKYGFENQKEKFDYKDKYAKYKLFKKEPRKYPHYALYAKEYKRYAKYKKYVVPNKKYAKYGKYKKYDKREYDNYKHYGTQTYLDGHNRYIEFLLRESTVIGEANLGGGTLGPEISVGLHNYSLSGITDDSFRVESVTNASSGNSIPYVIKNGNGDILATIAAGVTSTRVKLHSGTNFNVYNSLPDQLVAGEISFEAANAEDADEIVFDTNLPISGYDKYRGKIKLKYCDVAVTGYCDSANSDKTTNNVWVINTLRLEPYTWGMGEIELGNVAEHNKVMTAVYRTYGYWKIKFSTKHRSKGFLVTRTAGDQKYYGYNHEVNVPSIKTAAQATQGKLIMYLNSTTNEIALAPYSSWTDGRTRSFEEKWGSTNYPWLQSVSDPYGKHSTSSTAQLEAAGNHMVGLSAHGSVTLAYDHGWAWQSIVNYYYTNINILQAY